MNIFSLSFGKDSMATLLLAIEQGISIDHVMYCDIRFSDKISGEHPLMAHWIPEAEYILKNRFNITVEHAYSGVSFRDQFYKVKQKGNRKGQIYGFPYLMGAWCNSRLKLLAIDKYYRQFKGHHITRFVGIAYDELHRWYSLKSKDNYFIDSRSLLIENKLVEHDAFKICEKYGLLSPLYTSDSKFYRGGCWFCPKQCLSDLYYLWKDNINYYLILESMEKDSPILFRDGRSLLEFRYLFESGYVPVRRKQRSTNYQLSIFDFI